MLNYYDMAFLIIDFCEGGIYEREEFFMGSVSKA